MFAVKILPLPSALTLTFSDFEVASKSIKECIPTKYKEVIRCKTSGKAVRRYASVLIPSISFPILFLQSSHLPFFLTFSSCLRVVWLEERNFRVFEGVSFCGAVLSSLAVYVRQRQLDRRMMKRLQAQLSSCA